MKRGHWQGVTNILRFNWHFYALAAVGIPAGVAVGYWLGGVWVAVAWAVAVLLVGTLVFGLIVSYYVYDRTGLYGLDWLDGLRLGRGERVLNIHAGFDEFSGVLSERFPNVLLTVADFYDPAVHTEVSVARARRAYPPFPGTVSVRTTDLPFAEDDFAAVFVCFSAHEIREDAERVVFFRELRRVTRPGAPVVVLEHLRDAPNALAYTFGVFHFLPRPTWLRTFTTAGWHIADERKYTPFLTLFTLR